MTGHYKDEIRIVGRARDRSGLVHIAEEREFKRSGLRVLFEHCNHEALFPENLISDETPISCLTCLAAAL